MERLSDSRDMLVREKGVSVWSKRFLAHCVSFNLFCSWTSYQSLLAENHSRVLGKASDMQMFESRNL